MCRILTEYRPLALRNDRVGDVFRVQAAILKHFRDYLTSRRFTEIVSSKIVASGTEGGTNLFEIKYFDRVAYLAQSPQFYKQTMVGVFERVYEVGPVFRAEPHDTARHLAQYTSLDAEFGFIHDHHDVMAVLREVCAGMVAATADRASGENGNPGISSASRARTAPAPQRSSTAGRSGCSVAYRTTNADTG